MYQANCDVNHMWFKCMLNPISQLLVQGKYIFILDKYLTITINNKYI